MGSGAEAASAVLQTASLSNDVLTLPIVGGMTDWVVTFPTKRPHVDVATAADVSCAVHRQLGRLVGREFRL